MINVDASVCFASDNDPNTTTDDVGMNTNASLQRNLLRTSLFISLDDLLAEQNDEQQYDDEEAITHRRDIIKAEYLRLTIEEPSASIISNLLPASDPSGEIFKTYYLDLNQFVDTWIDKEKTNEIYFKLMNAKLTLQLIGGDDDIERHSISNLDEYKTYSYDDMPHLWQLLILSWRLCQVDRYDFVESFMVEKCYTPSGWRQFGKLFLGVEAFRHFFSFDNVGLALEDDRLKGRPFVKELTSFLDGEKLLPSKDANRVVHHLVKAYLEKRKERSMPLIEALFMVMRGHNEELLNPDETNEPACAEGAYLGMLRSIGEMVTENQFFLSGITIDQCG